MLAGHRVVIGLGVVVEVGDDHAFAGKACVEVDVGIGDVLVLDARQPDDFAQAQIGLQLGFDLRPAHARIAVAVDPAALGHDRRAVAINFNATALTGQLTADVGGVGLVAQFISHQGVVSMGLLVAPTVEVEVHQAATALIVHHKAAAKVAHPDVIQRHTDELDIGGAALAFGQRQLRRATEHGHRLVLGDGLGQQRHGVVYRRGPIGPDARGRAKGQENSLLQLVLIRHVPAASNGGAHLLSIQA